jgi:hypothetical protein
MTINPQNESGSKFICSKIYINTTSGRIRILTRSGYKPYIAYIQTGLFKIKDTLGL